MVGIVQERIRDLQQQQEQLKRELAQASMPKQRLVSEANRKFEAALALFSKLRQSLIRSDFKTLRDCLEKTIDKVVVKVGKTRQGRRNRYHLLGGEIHPQVCIVYGSTRWTHMQHARRGQTETNTHPTLPEGGMINESTPSDWGGLADVGEEYLPSAVSASLATVRHSINIGALWKSWRTVGLNGQ